MLYMHSGYGTLCAAELVGLSCFPKPWKSSLAMPLQFHAFRKIVIKVLVFIAIFTTLLSGATNKDSGNTCSKYEG